MTLLPLGVGHLIADSIALLQKHEPKEGYYGCFSGGKDSVVIKELAEMAGVKASWNYNVTTIDPPELVRFIKRAHPDVIWHRPKINFFKAAAEKRGFPTRRARWCCQEYKEFANPRDRILIMGIRAEESPGRAKLWSQVQTHWQTGSLTVQPILYWASDELWQFIRERSLPYCELYDQGFHRLGCVGCPSARAAGKRKEFDRWPKFEARWRYVFRRVYERRTTTLQKRGEKKGQEWFGDAFFTWTKPHWRSGAWQWTPEGAWERMWEWWLSDESLVRP